MKKRTKGLLFPGQFLDSGPHAGEVGQGTGAVSEYLSLAQGVQKIIFTLKFRQLNIGIADFKGGMGVTAGRGREMIGQGELAGHIGGLSQRSAGVKYLHHVDLVFDFIHDLGLQGFRTDFIKGMLGAQQTALVFDPFYDFLNGQIAGHFLSKKSPMISPLVVSISSATMT